MKLLVHGPRNNLREWFCSFTQSFTDKLKTEGITVERHPIKRKSLGGPQIIDLFDREIAVGINNMLVVNPGIEKYVMFTSFYDLRQFMGSGEIPQDQLLRIYSGHYDKHIIARDCRVIKDKFSPWYFRPWQDYRFYDYKWAPKNDHLFFRGLDIPKIREMIKIIHDKNIDNLDISCNLEDRQNFEIYHQNAISALVNLSVSGIRDMCHRDIELWKMGCPFIKPRFTSKLQIEIPDDVYFPVEWEIDREFLSPIPKDSRRLAEDIIEKYNTIKNDRKLLNKTSDLGKKFWSKHFTLEKIVDNSFRLLKDTGILDE